MRCSSTRWSAPLVPINWTEADELRRPTAGPVAAADLRH